MIWLGIEGEAYVSQAVAVSAGRARTSDVGACDYFRHPSRDFCIALHPKLVNMLHKLSLLFTNHYHSSRTLELM